MSKAAAPAPPPRQTAGGDDDEGGQEMGDEAAGANEEAGFQTAFKARESKVNSSLSGGRHKDALLAALDNPPLGTKSDAIKDQSADLVVSILNAVKEADQKAILDALNDDQLDLLMKYIYRGMQNADNSASLLKWHASVTDKAGLGCIMRALSEKKTVV